MNEETTYVLFLLWIIISAGIGGYIGQKLAKMTCPHGNRERLKSSTQHDDNNEVTL